MPPHRRLAVMPSGLALVLAGTLNAAAAAALHAQAARVVQPAQVGEVAQVERAAQRPEPAAQHGAGTVQPLRFFFVADAHSRQDRLEQLLEQVARERPAFVIDGGDMVHDGTEPEFLRALGTRAAAAVPWYVVRGNHDAVLRGRFANAPPAFADVEVLEHADVRFILLDNHRGVLEDAQFAQLEAALAAHAGRRSIVVMHVPPFLEREPAAARLRGLLPFPLAPPTMTDPAQVERFTALMQRHGVLAVLAGHTHAPSEAELGGVRYVVAGALGGLTPGFGIRHEYLDITVTGRDVQVTRVPVGTHSRDPFSFVVRAFRFYTTLNSFNHAELGWRYIPSASVQLRSGLARIESRGTERAVAVAAASFERVLADAGVAAFFADAGILAGRHDAALTLGAGYRRRPVGTFNRNAYVSLAAVGNAGVLAERWTAGIGVQAGMGVEWRSVTLEVAAARSTNHRAATITAGRRF